MLFTFSIKTEERFVTDGQLSSRKTPEKMADPKKKTGDADLPLPPLVDKDDNVMPQQVENNNIAKNTVKPSNGSKGKSTRSSTSSKDKGKAPAQTPPR